jgi:hypothetical protein
MGGDADLLAHGEDWASGTVRQAASADMLSKGNEQAVDLDPIFFRENLFQNMGGFFGGTSRDVPPTVGNAMDMHINTDLRKLTGDG